MCARFLFSTIITFFYSLFKPENCSIHIDSIIFVASLACFNLPLWKHFRSAIFGCMNNKQKQLVEMCQTRFVWECSMLIIPIISIVVCTGFRRCYSISSFNILVIRLDFPLAASHFAYLSQCWLVKRLIKNTKMRKWNRWLAITMLGAMNCLCLSWKTRAGFLIFKNKVLELMEKN